jgi:primosomal protein N' (replication factor Y) (superfamily II helicase)
VPRLELDRPFTYLLSAGLAPGTGHLVSVPFHGRTVKGWVLGPAEEVPPRVLPVRRVLSAEPLFGDRELALYRWISERYVAPLSAVIDRAHPPRVASEEGRAPRPAAPPPPERAPALLGAYRGGAHLVRACREGDGAFVFRPLPDDEAAACVEAVAACVEGGRGAVVVVPEAEPLPATARAVAEAFGPAALLFIGGERRERYRAWLDVQGGRYRVVIGTRPSVFASVPRLGLVWVNREAHPGHREERAPYYRTREVALKRAELEGGVCVLSAHGPSAEAVSLVEDGRARLVRAPRQRERDVAPLVEVARPGEEDRSPRLGAALKNADGAFLMVSRRGYGIARVCRSCGEPARCSACAGPVVVRRGRPACAVCGAEARCPSCGSADFGVERGGTERVEEWASGVTGLPVARVDESSEAVAPGPGRVLVGTAAAVKDFGALRVGLVAILDPDRARRRAGLSAPEQVLATWFEAATWTGPRGRGGRVVVQTREPGDPAIQALVRWDPWHFHRAERRRREEAGFPPGFPVFRVLGSGDLPMALESLGPAHLLTSALGTEAVCLATVRPTDLSRFRQAVVALAERGTVRRVEAEPQL